MILHYFHYESLDSSPASGPPSPPLRVPRPTRAAFVHHLASPAVFAAAGLVLALFAPAAARAQNPPTITGIESLAITSTPGNYHSSGKIYGPGETIAVTVTFNEAVTVDEGGGTPSLELDLSGTPTPALYRRGSGTTELVFERVVTDTDESRHGVAIGANKLELNGGTIRNQSGVDAGLIHAALERNRDHRVGDIVRIVDFSFEEVPAGGVYVIGDTVRLHAHFTGAVWVQGGWGSARVAISVGNDVRTARASSRTGDGNEQLVFDSYVVTEGDLDEDGLSLSANAVSGDIRYSTSLGAFEEHGEWSPPTPVRVDGVRPTVQSAVVNGPTLTLTFSETLNADSTPSPSAFTVGLGSLPALPVDSVVVEGTTTTLTLSHPLTGSHVVTLDYTPPTGANAKPLEDVAGNDALAFDELGVTNHGGIVAGIGSLAITSTPGNYHSSGKIYGPGETIAVTVTFNEAVTVNEGGGTPSLELDLSGTPTPALYRRGSGTTELVFERVVTDTDESRHGVAIGANKLELNGGTIRNQSGVDAVLIHAALERNGDHRVGDIVRIVDFSFEEVPAGGAYAIGDTVRLHAHFTRAVWVQGGWGSARVAISVGNDVRTARASSRTGDDNEQLVFDSYVVTEGDLDEDGLSLSANAVSGDIRYSTSLGAFEEHGEWSPATPVRVDGVRPSLVGAASPSGREIVLTFSETLARTTLATSTLMVLVADSPRPVDRVTRDDSTVLLLLDSAVTPGQAVTVRYADPGADDDAEAIQDLAGNNADSFSFTGTTGGADGLLSSDATLSALALSPGTLDPGFSPAHTSYAATVRNSETRVTVTAMANDDAATIEYLDASDVALTDADTSAEGHQVSLSEGDNAIKVKVTAEDGTAQTYTVTATRDLAPTVLGLEVLSTGSECGNRAYVEGDVFEVGVNFSKAVTVDTSSGTPTLELRMCAYNRDATYARGSGTAQLVYSRRVGDEDWSCHGQSPAFRSDALTLEGGAIRSSATQTDADLTTLAVPRLEGEHLVANRVHTGIRISSTPANGHTFGIGETVQISLGVDGATAVVGSPPMRFGLLLGDGSEVAANRREARGVSGSSGAREAHYRYTVEEGDEDTDGVSIGRDAIRFNVGRFQFSSDRAVLAQCNEPVGPFVSHKVDGVRPTLERAVTLPDGTQVILTFSETLSETTAPASAFAVLVAGSPRTVNAATTSGATVTLTLDSAVMAGETVMVAYADPNGYNDANAVQDEAGNDAASFGTQTVTNNVEAPPSVSSVALTSDPGADATYAIGDTIRATVTFTAAVDVNATGNQPRLELDIAGTPEQAGYESGSGTAALVFAWTVADNREDADGIEIGANKLTLNAGTIRKAGSTTIDAVLDHAAVDMDSAHKVDGVRPTLVTSGSDAPETSADGTQVLLTFSETLSQTTATTSAFTVMVANSSRTVDTATASGAEVTLTLASAVAAGETVTVAYEDPTANDDANAVQDTAGNDAASFDAQAVTNTVVPQGTLVLNLDTIAEDYTVNMAEHVAGFTISGDTGSEGGVSVTVTVGTTDLPATSSDANPAAWSVSVPPNSAYIIEPSVTITVSASKAGVAAPADVTHKLAVDLMAPTTSYTAPDALQVGVAIMDMTASTTASDIASYGVSGLPSGLTIDTDTGVISGTPDMAAASTAIATVTVTDTAGNSADASISFPVVDKGDQELTDFSYSPATVRFGDAAPTVAAPTGARTTVSYSATPADVCTAGLSTGVLTLLAVGVCEITATAKSDANYNEATAEFTVTVQPVGTVTVSVAPASVAEGEAVEFTVTLSGAVGSDVELGWSTADGTATSGDDYTAVTSGTLTIATGDTTGTLTVATSEDLLAEGNETFTVTLGTATATGTIEDDDPLGASVAADAGSVTEGGTAEFTVTLTGATSTAPVVVTYSVTGTAASGTDYTAQSGSLTIATGDSTGTISIPILDDGVLDSGETLTVTLDGASTTAGTATVDATAATTTITDPRTVTVSVAKAWLARSGRTIAQHVLDGLQERLRAPREAGFDGTLAGRVLETNGAGWREERLPARADRREEAWRDGWDGPVRSEETVTLRNLVTGSAFRVGAQSGENAFAEVWGRGAHSSVGGADADLRLDGEVTTGVVGADYRRGRMMGGAALSYSEANADYRSDAGDGRVGVSLTGLYPYVGFAVTDRVSVWGAGGYGEGEFKGEPDEGERAKSDLRLTMVAAGLRATLAKRPDGLEAAAKADVLHLRMTSFETARLEAAEGRVERVRLGLEGTRPFALESGASVTPELELGVRHDGGDAETGFGVDLGAGLKWSAPGRRLSGEVDVRGLVVHEDEDFEEWTVSGTVRHAPATRSGRGLSYSLTRSWGAPGTGGGADWLWAHETLPGLGAGGGGDSGARLDAEVGYGFPVLGSRGVTTPHAGLARGEESGTLTLGQRLELGASEWRVEAERGVDDRTTLRAGYDYRPGADFDLRLEATRREPAAGAGAPEHGITLQARIRW